VVHVSVSEPRKGNALAISALVLGIIAALISWIPFLGLLSVPVGLLGMLLGLIGLAIALIGRRSGLAASLVGTGISLGSIVLCALITGRTAQEISESIEKQRRETGPVAKPVVELGDRVTGQPKTEPTKLAIPQPSSIEKVTDTPTVKSLEEWVTAPTPARLGDVIIKVLSVKVAQVALKGTTGEGQSSEPQLIVNLEMSNTNLNRKIDYQTWAGNRVSFERDFATLQDNNGNSYKRISFGIFDQPIGRVMSESIYPEKVVTDVLVFEIPLKSADYLNLELPASNVGEQGFFRIRIPTSLIER
jgi:hypothetical protein